MIRWSTSRSTSLRALLLCCVGMVWLGVPASHAQQTASVAGRIEDETGDPVPAVLVTLSPLSGLAPNRTTLSDVQGMYGFVGLAPGEYRLRVSYLGYRAESREIELAPGEAERLDWQLEVAAVEVEGVDVRARRDEQRERARFESEAGVTARVVEGEQLKLVPGLAEADVLRAIEVLPGVISTSDFSSAFNVRGGSADQNLILLDGFPLFNPFHLGGLFSVFNSDVIARAELFAGGFGAEYGGRVSSVLNVETKTEPVEGGIRGEAGVSLLATRIALLGNLPPLTAAAPDTMPGTWFLSARRSYFDQILRPVADFPYHLTDLQGGLAVGTPGGGRFRLVGYAGRDVLDLSDFTPPGETEATDILRIQWNWGNRMLGARLDQPVGEWLSTTRLGFSGFDEELGFVDFGDTEFRSRIGQWTAGTDWARDFSPALTLKVGAEANRIGYRNIAAAGGTEFFGNDDNGTLGAGYAALRWRPSSNWLIEPGIRGDVWAASSTTRSLLSPRFAIKRFFGSERNAAVKLAAGRYVQFLHSLRDENLPVSNDRWILANRAVPPVVSDQLQLGAEIYGGDDWYASAEVYLRDFDGVIDLNLADDPNLPDDDFLVGDGFSYGIDFLLRRNTGRLTGWTTLSLLRAERTFPDPLVAGFEDLPQQVTFAPIFDRRVDVELVLQYALPWELESGLRWNFGSGLPFTRPTGQFYGWEYDLAEGRYQPADAFDEGPLYYVLLGPRNAERYPAYHRLDVTVRREFPRRWGTIRPYLQVLNLYNQRNVLFYFYNFRDNPATRSGVSMFPLLPAVGARGVVLMRGVRRLLDTLLLGIFPLLGSCVLADVTTVAGEDVLVVEGVLRAGAERQIILLHRSVQDRIVRGEPDATVIVRTPEGREIRFEEQSSNDSPVNLVECVSPVPEVTFDASCYASPDSVGSFVEAGKSYELEVRTRAGEQLRARTQVPSPFFWSFVSRPPDGQIPACEIPPGEPWEVAWAPSEGAWSYVADLEIVGLRERLAEAGVPPEEIPDPLNLFGLAISDSDTTLVVPTNFGLFERFDFDQRLLQALQQGFPEGTSALLTLAAADRNYVNGIRGGNFNPSGPVRVGSVVGDGVGTFGSLYPIRLLIDVRPGPISCLALPPDELRASALLRSDRPG